MRIRLRGPDGQSAITLSEDATVGDMIAQIIEKTAISSFDIKYGYPPKSLPLEQKAPSLSLASLDVNLNGETLILSPKESSQRETKKPVDATQPSKPSTSVSFAGKPTSPKPAVPISLKKKAMEGEVPEIPLPDRGATLGKSMVFLLRGNYANGTIVLRVMPDDNSCLFRAFGTANLPGDDLSMTELRAIVASTIQAEPEVYTKVVLEQNPDDYCRWIQTHDAWGGAIEMGILSKYFDVEICSIDVKVCFPLRSGAGWRG